MCVHIMCRERERERDDPTHASIFLGIQTVTKWDSCCTQLKLLWPKLTCQAVTGMAFSTTQLSFYFSITCLCTEMLEEMDMQSISIANAFSDLMLGMLKDCRIWWMYAGVNFMFPGACLPLQELTGYMDLLFLFPLENASHPNLFFGMDTEPGVWP